LTIEPVLEKGINMNATPSLNDLMDKDYPVTIRRKKGNAFVAGFEDLGLFASAQSIPDVVEKLEQKKRGLFEDLIENEAVENLPEPTVGWRRANRMGHRGSDSPARLAFFVFVGIFGAFVVLGGLATLTIPSIVDRVAERASQNVMRIVDPLVVARKVAPLLDRFATQMKNVSPQRREEVLSDIRDSVAALQPYVNEIRPLMGAPVSGAK